MKIRTRQVKIGKSGMNLYRPNYPNPPKRHSLLKNYIHFLIFVLLIGSLIDILFFSPLVKINKITVEGKTTLPAEEIIKQVNQAIYANITGNNLILLNTSQIEDQLVNQNYQLFSAKVSKVFPGQLKVSVKEKQPSIIWKSGEVAYLLSEDGRAIAASGDDHNLPVIYDSANLPVKLGEKIVPTSFISFVLDMIKGLQDRGISPVLMEVPDTTSELYIKTNKNYLLKLDTTRSVASCLSDLDSVLKTLAKQGKKPNEYIDLRIEGKVFLR